MASSERIFKVLDEPATIQDPSEPEEFGNVQGEIEFKDVWFAYNPGDWVLKGISFNPEILLILDEATSSVDTETEVLIEDALNKLMLNRTSIIIAHRLSTIRNVDRIIFMHKGRIVEQGTHEQLLGQQGVYRRLYDFQYAQ